MQSFYWKVFALTGDVDAYLLFKNIHQNGYSQEFDDEGEDDDALVYGEEQ